MCNRLRSSSAPKAFLSELHPQEDLPGSKETRLGAYSCRQPNHTQTPPHSKFPLAGSSVLGYPHSRVFQLNRKVSQPASFPFPFPFSATFSILPLRMIFRKALSMTTTYWRCTSLPRCLVLGHPHSLCLCCRTSFLLHVCFFVHSDLPHLHVCAAARGVVSSGG